MMRQSRIDFEFKKLKEVFPDTKLARDRTFIYIPTVLLPHKFNENSTPVLISLTKEYTMFGVPAVYVSRKLKIRRGNGYYKSVSLDENLTETDMLQKGWVKLCWYNPPKTRNLCELMANVIFFLEGLKA